MDPYIITPAERSRFGQQFSALKPNNGIVTGEQAKGFFLQSQLPPAILGIIWGLADTDADGKMNINEFSIACKLINLKLRGFEIPKALPPALLGLVTTPVNAGPLIGVPPAKPPVPPLPGAVPSQPLIPGISPIPNTAPPPRPSPIPVASVNRVISPPSGGTSPIMSPPSQIATPVSQVQVIASPPRIPPAMPIVPLQPVAPISQPIVPPQPVVLSQTVIPPQTSVITSQPLLQQAPLPQTLVGPKPPMPPVTAPVPPSTLIGLTQAQPAIPIAPVQPLERVASLESPLANTSPLLEWAVPQASKLKYTQLFNTTDKSRTGFLSGAQARNILLASQLPQSTLAQIWALSDMDSDGRLSCEEFVLALHLCDMARNGETIPVALPLSLVPPTLRRQRNNSLTASEQGDPLAGISSVTFEDKRKENFEKGQAELERRRKALLETQRKEQEERERKEREEREKQEKIRLEQERKRQEEFERQVERQRELEKAKEEERKRAHEQREAARREMERQRQVEWEKQRSQELQAQRQKQQEQVLSIKAKNQTLTIELSQLNEKVKDLSRQISETRCGVTGVKSTIDGMRATRDEQMAELNRLKALLKQQNQRLVALSQQKAKLEAQGKLGKDIAGEEQARLAFNSKQITIKNLKEKVADLEEQVKVKMSDVENNNSQLDTLKDQLSSIVSECEELYVAYDLKRKKAYELKGGRTQDVGGWGESAWDTAPSWPEETMQEDDIPGYKKYRALYEFVARNSDELSFQPGDTIMVPTAQNAEPGWLSGELRGATGWFPESYVEPLDGSVDNSMQNNMQPKTQLEGIAEVAENVSENDFTIDDGPPLPHGPEPILGLGQPVEKIATAQYSFIAKKSSQVSFTKEETFRVTELQDQWCYGEVNGKEGWLPKSYVTLTDATVTNAPVTPVQMDGAIPPDQQECYVSMYPYQSEEVGDLTFDQGETILVVAKEGDWWTGVIGSRSGIFPSNYVQKTDVQEPAAAEVPEVVPEAVTPIVAEIKEEPIIVQQTNVVALEPQLTGGPTIARAVTPDFANLSSQIESGSGEDSDAKGGRTKKPEIATVIAPYQATSNEQLSLQRGQLIMIRKKTTTGWWEGELQAKGKKRQIGWFPASYVKLLGGGGGPGMKQQSSARTSGAATPSDSTSERVIALYQYVAQNEDELSFEKDDIITVIAKDEPSWWKGEFNGFSGLFPSNYVGPLSTNGKTKLRLNKDERKRQHCIKELIMTEQAYIEDMSIVHDVFEKPLIDSRLLSPTQIKLIFINWRDIIECNYTFLRALRVRRDMSESGVIRMVGDIICENLPRMTVYVRFCSCQLSAAALLQSLTEENKDFRSLAKRCQSDPRTQGLPLSSFLIKPMQRITKYPLFIQKILQHTPVGHPDRQYLEEALFKAEELCLQVNEGVREKENSERLEWLQTHVLSDGLSEPLIFNSLTNSVGPRKFVHFGVVWKTKSGKELVGFLMNDFLLLAQPNRPLGHQFSFERHQNLLFRIYKQPLLLNETIILNSPDGNDSVEMKLECNKVVYNLSAASQNERNLWLKKLNEAQNDLRKHEKVKLQRQESKQASFGACGRILVVVLEGRKLKPPTTVKREAFCEVSMGSQEHRTPAAQTPPGQEPKWNTSMQFLVKDLKEDVLCVTVRDKGHFSPDEFLGRTEVRVSEIHKAIQISPGPITKVLQLHEVRTGQVILKLGLQLFK